MLNHFGQRDLSLEARTRLEDAARAVMKALFVIQEKHLRSMPPSLPRIEDLRVAALASMRKFRSPEDHALSSIAEDLAFSEILREAREWADRIHPRRVAHEIDRLREIALAGPCPGGPAVDAFRDLIETVMETYML